MRKLKKIRIDIYVGLFFIYWFGSLPSDLTHVSAKNNNKHLLQNKQYNHYIEENINNIKTDQIHYMNSSFVSLRHGSHYNRNKYITKFSENSSPNDSHSYNTSHHLRHNSFHQTIQLPKKEINNNNLSNQINLRMSQINNTDTVMKINKLKTKNHNNENEDPHLQNLYFTPNFYKNQSKFNKKNNKNNQLTAFSKTKLRFISKRESKGLKLKHYPNFKISQLKRNSTSVDDYYDENNVEDETESVDDADNADNTDKNTNENNGDYDDEDSLYNGKPINPNERQFERRSDNLDMRNFGSKTYVPGILTQYKYKILGTHEAVERSRISLFANQMQHRTLANAHANKVFVEATCKYPKPRIEKIQKDPSKVYVPHCTILHRCSDDTGCCSTDSHMCIAKRLQSVDLYFFVKTFGSKQGTVEKHTFINHTECHCVDRAKSINYSTELDSLRQASILDCICPKLFEKVLQENGFCRCDCSSSNSGCDWLKRGMEHFSVIDRKCINEGRCKPPTCEFGAYIKKHGRCPRKDDKLTTYSKGFL